MLSSSLLDNGCVQSVRVDDDRGCRSMIIDDFVRFISSTQSPCECLKLLIANACMMGIPGQPPSTFFLLATGCVQSVCVEDDRGVRSMIIDEIVRFISSTQSHCG